MRLLYKPLSANTERTISDFATIACGKWRISTRAYPKCTCVAFSSIQMRHALLNLPSFRVAPSPRDNTDSEAYPSPHPSGPHLHSLATDQVRGHLGASPALSLATARLLPAPATKGSVHICARSATAITHAYFTRSRL